MVYPKWDSLCLVVHVPTCLLTPQEPLCFLFPVIIHLSEGRNNTDVRVMKKQHWAMTGELGFSLCSSGMRSLAIYFSVDFKSFFLSLV